jgi:nicotinate (nicotinamide) nucleotide adenylyltransferase
MSELIALSARINTQFEAVFGRTPLFERVHDILAQATTLGRFADLNHLREETGDILCSVLQLCTECGWDPASLVGATLDKIGARRDIYARLGRKLNVALLGGAFDPIHRGHLEVATEVLRLGRVDEVWLMPCFDHLSGKSMVPADHRLEMCRLAARTVRGIGIFDYEIRHQFRGETYHLVKQLLAEDVARVRCDFSLVIGQDNADGFSTWTNAEGLERLVPFIVLPRAGCPPPRASAWYLRGPHQYLEAARQQYPISSTEVRGWLQAGDPNAEKLLVPDVVHYIRTHRLYEPASPATPALPRNRKVAVFASTFDPPTRFHRRAVEALLRDGFDSVVVCPTGPRPGHTQPEHAAPADRAALADIGFRGLARVQVDLADLDEGRFTPPIDLETRYATTGEVWHVIGADMVTKGAVGRAVVQTLWEKGDAIWAGGRFVVLHGPDALPDVTDLPPANRLLPVEEHVPSARIRAQVFEGNSPDEFLTPEVAGYIARRRLFIPFVPGRGARLVPRRPRLRIAFDERNAVAVDFAHRYQPFAGDPPDMVLVIGGDGTMLHAIRQLWRLRVPFLGINAGHLGFLMNEWLPPDLDGLDLITYSLPMLRIDAEAPDGRVARGLAYSDAWLERADGQAAWLRLEVDGQTRVPKVIGDGMLVSTASGSSAYARAMGAVPVPLDTPVLTLAGSNIFRPRFWKPMTLADDAVITLTNLDRSGKRTVRGFLDGQPLGVVQGITVRKSAVAAVELTFTREFDASGKLLRSLFPPQSGDD